MYSNLNYYKNEFFGFLIPDAQYNYYAKKASGFIMQRIMGKEVATPLLPLVQNAECEVSEYLFQRPQADIGSESNGSYSVSYRDVSQECEIYRIIERYLSGTGLISRWI